MFHHVSQTSSTKLLPLPQISYNMYFFMVRFYQLSTVIFSTYIKEKYNHMVSNLICFHVYIHNISFIIIVLYMVDDMNGQRCGRRP